MQVDVAYPSPDAERRMMISTTTGIEDRPRPVLDANALMRMQELVRRVPVGEQIVDMILRLVRAGRPDNRAIDGIDRLVAWGPGPRASQALMLAVRARALLDRRLAPAVEDVLTLAGPVLRHRMAVTFAARAEGVTIDDVIGRLIRHVA
jgi:MoxR-like ATPase